MMKIDKVIRYLFPGGIVGGILLVIGLIFLKNKNTILADYVIMAILVIGVGISIVVMCHAFWVYLKSRKILEETKRSLRENSDKWKLL